MFGYERVAHVRQSETDVTDPFLRPGDLFTPSGAAYKFSNYVKRPTTGPRTRKNRPDHFTAVRFCVIRGRVAVTQQTTINWWAYRFKIKTNNVTKKVDARCLFKKRANESECNLLKMFEARWKLMQRINFNKYERVEFNNDIVLKLTNGI